MLCNNRAILDDQCNSGSIPDDHPRQLYFYAISFKPTLFRGYYMAFAIVHAVNARDFSSWLSDARLERYKGLSSRRYLKLESVASNIRPS